MDLDQAQLLHLGGVEQGFDIFRVPGHADRRPPATVVRDREDLADDQPVAIVRCRTPAHQKGNRLQTVTGKEVVAQRGVLVLGEGQRHVH